MKTCKQCVAGIQTTTGLGDQPKHYQCNHCGGTGNEPVHMKVPTYDDWGCESGEQDVYTIVGELTAEVRALRQKNYDEQDLYWPVLYREGKPICLLSIQGLEYGATEQFEKMVRLIPELVKNTDHISYIRQRRCDGPPPIDKQTVFAW